MNTEIEAKFLAVRHEEIRRRLSDLGAECEQPMRLMRRVTIDTPFLMKKNAFVRIRDEGHRVSVTYKQFDELSLSGAKEIEIIVSDFDKAVRLFDAAGLSYRSFQESKRETWKLDDVEIVLDEWPWLKPYIEIEGKSEAAVRSAAEKLELSWDTAVFGDVMAAYRAEYPHLTLTDTVGTLPEVKFNDPLFTKFPQSYTPESVPSSHNVSIISSTDS